MIKAILIKLHFILASQFGLDPQRMLRSIRGLPMYLRDWVVFRKGYAGKIRLMPCLHDRYEECGATKSEYFWQDLLVARAIHDAKPVKHVDIGSRVDGFVAHVASFRDCEVFDVRPMTMAVPGVVFRRADLMNIASLPDIKGNSLAMLGQGVVSIIFMIVGAKYLGMLGVVLAPLVATLLISGWYYPRVFIRLIELPRPDIWAFVHECLRVCVALLATALVMVMWANVTTWWAFTGAVLAMVLCYFTVLYLVSPIFRDECLQLRGYIF